MPDAPIIPYIQGDGIGGYLGNAQLWSLIRQWKKAYGGQKGCLEGSFGWKKQQT